MAGRPVLMALLALGGGAVIASASGDGRPHRGVSSSSTLRLPDLDRCIVRGRIRVTVAPPAGTSFASLAVRAGGLELLQLADLAGPGSVVVRLPRAGAKVHVTATTSDGQFLEASRRYRPCRAAPTRPVVRKPTPRRPRERQEPAAQGGGED